MSRHGVALRLFSILASAMFLALIPLTAVRAASGTQFLYGVGSTNQIYGFSVNSTTGELTPIPGSPFTSRLDGTAAAVDPQGQYLFVANYTDNDVSVFSIDQTTGAITEVPNSPFDAGTGTEPTVLTVDPSGSFLFVGNEISLTTFTGTDGAADYQGDIDVYEINRTTGELTPSPNSQSPSTAMQCPINPVGLVAVPQGTYLYMEGGYDGSINGDGTSLGEEQEKYSYNSTTGDLTNLSNIPMTAGSTYARALAGDQLGQYLITGFGQMEGFFVVESLIPPLESSSEVQVTVGYPLTAPSELGVQVDSTNNFVFSGYGEFSVSLTGGTGGIPIMTQINTQAVNFCGVTDRIAPFCYGSGSSTNELTGYQIDPTTGALTQVPGSTYAAAGVAYVITGYPTLAQAPAVNFSPTSLNFGVLVLGTPSTEPLTLYNTGTQPLTISAKSISGTNAADFSETDNCPASLAAGANCTFNITFTAPTSGGFSAQLNVTDNAATSPQAVLLSGTGGTPTPAISLAPTSLTFASTIVGNTSAPMTVTVTNTGTAALSITTVALGGPNPGDFTTTGCNATTLAVNATCTISVTFQPQAVGQRTANITITDNAANSPQTVSIVGTAAAPFTLTTAAGSAAGATISAGQTAQFALSLTDTDASFTGNVTLACSGAPTGDSCTVSPASVDLTSMASNSVMVSVGSSSTMMTVNPNRKTRRRFPGTLVLFLLASLSMILGGLLLAARMARERFAFRLARPACAALALVFVAILGMSACAGSGTGGGTGTGQSGSTTYTITVTATSGNISVPTTLTLTVTN